MDARWKWLQMRINSSLRPRPDDLHQIFCDENNCRAARSFFNNEDVRKVFVFIEAERKIVLSVNPPAELHRKSVFFYKTKPGVKLTADNLDEELVSIDCGENVLENLGHLTKDIYLPLLCTNVGHADAFGVSADQLMDSLHRLMASIETTRKLDQGEVVLALPSVEVLTEVVANKGRKSAVLHILETTVVGWCKQIEKVLMQDPIVVLHSEYGDYPGPLDEIEVWMSRHAKLCSISRQLNSPVALNVFQSLRNAGSSYIHSFQKIVLDINKATEEANENLTYLETMNSMFDRLHVCSDPTKMARIFPPLVHTLFLVWSHSKYYHQPDKFRNLLGLICNAIIRCAETIIGEEILSDPGKSYTLIKETVRACACFRGVYLDYRAKTDEINNRNKEELAIIQSQMPKGQFGLLSVKMYGSNAYKPQSDSKWKHKDEIREEKEDKLKVPSFWPPRNAKEFDRLNAYTERCNDVLELVQTIQHFQLLSTAADIGGAGSTSLDVLVREIYQKYSETTEDFLYKVPDVLDIDDDSNDFAEAFFAFRSVVKGLEKKMADVLHSGFSQCSTITDKLRLLEVFEGISGRHLIQALLKDEFESLVKSFTEEVHQVKKMFLAHKVSPPTHRNMPAIVNRLLWVHSLKQRIGLPMKKMQKTSPHLLEGEFGRQLVRAYADVKDELDRYQAESISDWQNGIPCDLTDRLNQPLLTSPDVLSEEYQPVLNVAVSLDPKLLLLLREISYLSREPFCVTLPHAAKVLLDSTDFSQIRTTFTRLETIVSKYNSVIRAVTPYELGLFHRALLKIWQLFGLGASDFTWCTEETADFLELANSLVCNDLYQNLDVVQMNCRAILQATEAWSKQQLDVFSGCSAAVVYSIDELKRMQEQFNKNFESAVIPAGKQIRKLLSESFKTVEISEASPAWQEYVAYIDTVVLTGLKSSCLSSLRSMLNRIDPSLQKDYLSPLLVIRMELVQGEVVFSPPLDADSISEGLQETIHNWLCSFIAHGSLITNIAGDTPYQDYIEEDAEVQQLLAKIALIIKQQTDECKKTLSEFKRFSNLWKMHIREEFEKFLRGKDIDLALGCTPSLPSSEEGVCRSASTVRASSSRSSHLSVVQLADSERKFLSLPPVSNSSDCRPTLDDFETVLEIYKDAHDSVWLNIPDEKDVDWIRIDVKPIKLVSTAYAKLIMWTYTQYLSEQVTKLMESLDQFLVAIEPEIEGITGEEKDTASFMRIMRTFHVISMKQRDMEGKFVALNRTVNILNAYEHKLPENTRLIYDSMPSRWTNLKTKVGQAKTKIGPKIREESASISKDLSQFGKMVEQLLGELKTSEIHQHTCAVTFAFAQIDLYSQRLDDLESEAQDLVELQDFLETSLVDFSLLRQYRHELSNLKLVWRRVQSTDERQNKWKCKRWMKIKTGLLRKELQQQQQRIEELPREVHGWDVVMKLKESVALLEAYLPVIDDLSSPAMRPRHWKHLTMATGGVVNTDSELLKAMTLEELLHLRLDKHADEVQKVAERAGLDVTVERCLKKYEEIWLSRIFDLQEHSRSKAILITEKAEMNNVPAISDNTSEPSSAGGVVKRPPSNLSSVNRWRRLSVLSLPSWLLVVGDNVGPIYLIANMDSILDELESHQVSLQALWMDSGIGSFLDDICHWQKTLQDVEVILKLWTEVQEKWIELEEVFSSQEVASCLPSEFGTFSQVNLDFRRLMLTVRENNNVLQCCQRDGMPNILDSLNSSLEKCQKSLLQYIEIRRHRLPRLYFLSTEDVLHILCNGFDVQKANLYIQKLFENVGKLIYTRIDDQDRSLFQITAVESHQRENLILSEPVTCEGASEKWLQKLVLTIKASVKGQLKAVSPSLTDGAVDSKPSTLDADEEMKQLLAEEKEKEFPVLRESNSQATRAIVDQINVRKEVNKDAVTEVVLLLARVSMTTQTMLALQEHRSGTKDALKVALDEVNKRLDSKVTTLAGLKAGSVVESQRSSGSSRSLSLASRFLPYEVTKLASLIVLACYERDLLLRMLTSRLTMLDTDYLWKSQLHYELNEEESSVQIKCLNGTFDYGFEYMGSLELAPIAAETERSIFNLTAALRSHSSALGIGTDVSVVKQLSQLLGRAFFAFDCAGSMSYVMLVNVMKGLACSGSWACFSRLSQLRLDVLSCFGELLHSVVIALRTRMSSVNVVGDELSVDDSGFCLATLDPAVSNGFNNPMTILRVPASTLNLPREVLDQFRTIGLTTPSIRVAAEVLLLSKGFPAAAQLAHKISLMFEMGKQLLEKCNHYSGSSSETAAQNAESSGVWNHSSLKRLVRFAAGLLDKQRAALSGDAVIDMKMQDVAIATALKNLFTPRLTEVSSLAFASLFQDLWPDVGVSVAQTVEEQACEYLPKTASSKSRRSGISCMDSRGSSTPVVAFSRDMCMPDVVLNSVPNAGEGYFLDSDGTGKSRCILTTDLHLQVCQLQDLCSVHQLVIIAGPVGCGKTTCLWTFASTQKERSDKFQLESIFINSLESDELIGHFDSSKNCWSDGLLPYKLRELTVGAEENDVAFLHLDGKMEVQQTEALQSLLNSCEAAVHQNGERIFLKERVKFILETDDLSGLSPVVLNNVGMMYLELSSEMWKRVLAAWLAHHPEDEKRRLQQLCNRYLPPAFDYLRSAGQFSLPGTELRHVVWQTDDNIISSLISLLESFTKEKRDLSETQLELCFHFSCIWAFGGMLDLDSRETFSGWWKRTFQEFLQFPKDGSVFDYAISSDGSEFLLWSSLASLCNDIQTSRSSSSFFVHTHLNERTLQLIDRFSRISSRPVMLFGDMGSGKTSLIEEHLQKRFLCDSMDDSVLHLQGSRFVNARLLHERIMEKMDWKHGGTFIPKATKRLICVLDDFNLCQMDKYENRLALELVRQHIDHGGFHGLVDRRWHEVQNVGYILAVNHNSSQLSKPLNQRLVRHFAMVACHLPTNEELQTIYGSVLNQHFTMPMMKSSEDSLSFGQRKVSSFLPEEQLLLRQHLTAQHEALHSLSSLLIRVTIEVHEKLRTMYLPTAERCHYVFNPRDLSVIFRNLSLSLQPDCKHESLLLLWEHECYWTYGHRMVSDIDFGRFRQTLTRAIEKNFTNQEHIRLLIDQDKLLFSNLVEHSSGLVTAGGIMGYASESITEAEMQTDLYKPAYDVAFVRGLLHRAVEEYNKSNPPITITLYKCVIEQVCRLARVLASPHDVAHLMLVAEGSAGFMTPIVNLATHLCGFEVFKAASASSPGCLAEKLASFKTDIMDAYTLSGVQGRKLVIVLEEEELLCDDFLVYLTEFIMTGSISHLFTFEEQTTIINSIRTEVTQAGLTYTRDVAWKYFLNTVKNNLRVCFIAYGGGMRFQQRCRDHINFTKSVSIIWFPHWTKRQLLTSAGHHLRSLSWMDRVQLENVTHLLATMHLTIRQIDRKKQTNGHYKHLVNLTYEKFVQRFVSLANARHKEIHSLHGDMVIMHNKLTLENSLATKLEKDLEHEKVVLEERRTGTNNLLSQIGQDAAIAEQQMKLVRAQMERTKQLKMRLPEYQVARERAVYKAVAIVADTKKIVKSMKLQHDSESDNESCGCLHCLRTKQKPSKEIEELLGAVIMILKSPQADRTWQKGAKRQMANLERFIEELISFDENSLPESTLLLVEAYLQKVSSEPEISKMSACLSLSNWIKGVARYHRMMISKVKPLHDQVTKTTKDIESTEQKMKSLETRRKTLETRLADLGKAFEEATIDKMDQLAKTTEMEKSLQMAAELKLMLGKEQRRIRNMIASLPSRESCLTGGVAIAAAFATYLGPYHYRFRHEMLTVHWPNCLRERGIPLIIDSVDQIRGYVIDWSMEEGVTNESESTEAEVPDEETEDLLLPLIDNPGGAETKDVEAGGDVNFESEMPVYEDDEREEEEEETRRDFAEGGSEKSEKEEDYLTEDSQTDIPYLLPAITMAQYKKYIGSIIKVLVGDSRLLSWTDRGFSSSQMENAAILFTSWQRVPLLIDSGNSGMESGNSGMDFYKSIIHELNPKKLSVLDINSKMPTLELIEEVECCIVQGYPMMLCNCVEPVDSLLMPLIDHFNSRRKDFAESDEPRLINFRNRRMLCHPSFRLFLRSSLCSPKLSPSVSSLTTPVNFGFSNETVFDDLLQRSFAILQPELSQELCKVKKSLRINTRALEELNLHLNRRLLMAAAEKRPFLDEIHLEEMSEFLHCTQLISSSITDARRLWKELDGIREGLFPLARRAAELFSIVRSLAVVYREYHFTYNLFVSLFDEALRGKPVSEAVGGFQEANARVAEDLNYERTIERQTTKDGLLSTDESETVNDSAAADEPGTVPKMKHSIYKVPQLPKLPSEGVTYAEVAESKVQQLMLRLTTLIFHRIKMSLYPEHRLLFALLISLAMNERQKFSEEEVMLLVYGETGIDLKADVDGYQLTDLVPDWLPSDKWRSLVSVSFLPGPLNGLCEKILQDSKNWKTWYESECPEKAALPLKAENQQDEELLTDLQRLVILRILRPDRMGISVSSILNPVLESNPDQLPDDGLNQLLQLCQQGQLSILVLLPFHGVSDNHCHHAISNIELIQSVTDSIQQLSRVHGVTMETVAMGQTSEDRVTTLLRAALTDENSWFLVQNVHLTSADYCEKLSYHLQLIAKDGNANSSTRGSLVWMTAEPSRQLPPELLQHLYPLCWDSVQQLAVTMGRTSSLVNNPAILTQSMDNLLPAAIISGMKSVPVDTWSQASSIVPHHLKLLIFYLGIANGILVARQLLGTRGMSHCYPLENGAYFQLAVEALLDLAKREQESDDKVQFLAKKIIQDIYENVITSIHDKDYLNHLLDAVTRAAFSGSELRIGSLMLPVPPSDSVDVVEFGAWLSARLESLSFSDAMSVPAHVSQDVIQTMSFKFLWQLEQVYTAEGFDIIDVEQSDTCLQSMLRLRTIVDHIKKELPPLLELPPGMQQHSNTIDVSGLPVDRLTAISSFFSMANSSSDLLSLVLLQECLCYNSLVLQILRDLHRIRRSLLGGKDFIPARLRITANSLYEERVPIHWVHANHRPILHSLTSWKDELLQRHKQLQDWSQTVLTRLPSSTADSNDSKEFLSQGLRLSGFANPGALLAALKLNESIALGCTIHEVELTCEVVPPNDNHITATNENRIALTDIYLQGASWDRKNERVALSQRQDLQMLPGLWIKARKTKEETEETYEICSLPVFVNRSRQVCIGRLLLKSSVPSTELIANGAAIVLDPGIPRGAPRTNPAFGLPCNSRPKQRSRSYYGDDRTYRGERRAVEVRLEKYEDMTDRSLPSAQSQLSYKPFTPNAPALPPELHPPSRDPPLDEKNSHLSAQGRNTYSRQDSKSETSLKLDKGLDTDADTSKIGIASERLIAPPAAEKKPSSRAENEMKNITEGENSTQDLREEHTLEGRERISVDEERLSGSEKEYVSVTEERTEPSGAANRENKNIPIIKSSNADYNDNDDEDNKGDYDYDDDDDDDDDDDESDF